MTKTKSILFVSSLVFLFKVLIEMVLQWIDVIPNKVKGHIWGRFDFSIYYIKYDFLFYFWLYIIAITLLYLIINRSIIKTNFIYVGIVILVLLFTIISHNFQVPFKNSYPKAEVIWNFQFLEQIIVYSLTGLFAVFLTVRDSSKVKSY